MMCVPGLLQEKKEKQSRKPEQPPLDLDGSATGERHRNKAEKRAKKRCQATPESAVRGYALSYEVLN